MNVALSEGIPYTSETILPGDGADTIDLSNIAHFAAQVIASACGPTIQLKESFDGGTTYANLGVAISATVGTIAKFSEGSGPYGLIKINIAGGTSGILVINGTKLNN